MIAIQFRQVLLIALILLTYTAIAQVRLPKLISDGMVLQRDSKVRIWGWASPHEAVHLNFNGIADSTITNEKGEWSVTLLPMAAGGPFTMTLRATNTITVNNILIGDVWICSGQSNMETTMKRVSPLYQNEIQQCENNFIRYFAVPQQYNFKAVQSDLSSGSWIMTNPSTIVSYSAVAYFFANELYEKYHIPIGLINASMGGAPVESWLSEDALKEFPYAYAEAIRFKDDALIDSIEHQDKTRINSWYTTVRKNDEGYKDQKLPWFSPDIDASDWQVMKIPGYWANEKPGKVNGVVWFRKEIEIPASMAGKAARLNLGRIVDADSAFVNGMFVGTTSYQYPPRRYEIPSGYLKQGRNVITVRVINNSGEGGFVEDKPYELICDNQTIKLTGEWKYKVGAVMPPLASQTFIRWKPLGLFNAMIYPLKDYSMKGVIWYQGESHVDRPSNYQLLFTRLIETWRSTFSQHDFPFIYVQLANYLKPCAEPCESNIALVREAQRKTLSVPNTSMVVSIDVGEWNDIHPLQKKPVGVRLAKAAEKKVYNDNRGACSPLYESMSIAGDKIILKFSNTGSGLVFKDGEPKHFAIAGADKKFVWANAKIKNNTVVVWSTKISKPVTVRYAWADNPAGANLYTKDGFPASPFSTDK